MSKVRSFLATAFVAANVMGGVSAAVRTDAVSDGLTAYWNQKITNPTQSDKTALQAMRYGTALLMTGPSVTYADITGSYEAKVDGMPSKLPRNPDNFVGELVGWQGHGTSTAAKVNESVGVVASFGYGVVSWPGQLVGSIGVVAVKDIAKSVRPN